MNKHLFSLFLLLSVLSSSSQVTSNLNSSQILQTLKKLNVTGSVLYVAAHPDDENTRLLAYLANEKKLRTGYLSITRGDGGQNLVGKEQGEMLGLIRTQELLAARRTDGAEQFFTRANDFGFSKNPEETFSFWNKDSILYDVVLTIRKFRPDVIICRFPTTGEGGHGHHTASAILALEAFDAAADSTRFPEQLCFTKTWKAKRIFWNTFNFGTTNTTSPDQLKIDVGVYNPLLGKSYGEIASESRSMHKSQGFGTARQRGSNIEYFKLLKGDSAKADLMAEVNTKWSRLKGTEKLQSQLDDCIKNFNAESPEKSVPALASIYKELFNLDEKNDQVTYWKSLKIKEAQTLILACSGLWLESYTTDYIGVPGQEINTVTQAVNRNQVEANLSTITFPDKSYTTVALPLKTNELFTFNQKIKLADSIPYSNPYWLNEKHEAGLYTVTNKGTIGKPENSPALHVNFNVVVKDLRLFVELPLVHKFTDPVKGEVYRPLEILPPASVNFSEKSYVFENKVSKIISLQVKANRAQVKGELKLIAPPGWSLTLSEPTFELATKGEEKILEARLTAGKDVSNGKIKAEIVIDGKSFNKSIRRIDYEHIPSQFILSEAESDLVTIDLKKSGTNIAYIPGAGDDVAGCLKQIGYSVTILSDEQLRHEDLSKFSAIVTGIRAYNTSDKLHAHKEKLMRFIKNGGNLIVQYNTNSRVGPLQASIGPYPFTISRERVTNENAPVVLKNEKHPALNYPNKISAKDFDGWVQERGIYFASELDKNYETILVMNDPNEKLNEGSLIVAKYGKGNFVYTGLVFFRELPAGVPGAYRLFANLLSLPQNK